MVRDYLNAYFRTISFIFLILFGIYAILTIGSEEYLKSFVTSFSYTLLPVVVGNIPIAWLYYYIHKKLTK
ncbi:hypothetical protein [Nonlabens xylanidelens]|uniref:hypothetical protein n=1 Tax=Nonlabens xylanidelens TaxID=191564 RepID=UPI000CEC4951|nr:hypothetical protein [Nonlabens xylanidelens]PQJ17803.1 hypothetical protein BST94_12290 [Nonlabens xylanidelens]